MKNDRREEKGFEAYIEKEFMNSENDITEIDLSTDKSSFRTYMASAFAFVMILIVFGVTGTYAYYTMEVENKFNTTSASANIDCFDVNLSSSGTYSLGAYNYPITDDFATSDNHLTPLTVIVQNTCSSGAAISYKLYLTTLPTNNANVPDSAMKINVSKTSTDSSASLTGISRKMINTLTPVLKGDGSNNIYNVLHEAIVQKETSDENAASIVDGNYYEVLSGSVKPNIKDTYSFTFWVDYDEGTLNNNDTEGRNFKALISAIIN